MTELAMIQTGETLRIHRGVLGKPAGFAEIHFAPQTANL